MIFTIPDCIVYIINFIINKRGRITVKIMLWKQIVIRFLISVTGG